MLHLNFVCLPGPRLQLGPGGGRAQGLSCTLVDWAGRGLQDGGTQAGRDLPDLRQASGVL